MIAPRLSSSSIRAGNRPLDLVDAIALVGLPLVEVGPVLIASPALGREERLAE
ncbi:MAG: hypothetical protein HQ453_13225 [Actinobacteria bacterium]|nr:hypothetical protein [Actinomycetota bacterium]